MDQNIDWLFKNSYIYPMPDAIRHIERFSAGVFPPKVTWEGGPYFSDKPRLGLVTHLNTPWIKLKESLPILGVAAPTIGHEYRDKGMPVNSINTETGIVVYDEEIGLIGQGLNLPWALRDLRRQLLLSSDIVDLPDSELSEFGLKQAAYLRRYIELLVPNPAEMLTRHS